VQSLGAADLAAESGWVNHSGYRVAPDGTFLFLGSGYRYDMENDEQRRSRSLVGHGLEQIINRKFGAVSATEDAIWRESDGPV
jgi:hypothetical protein